MTLWIAPTFLFEIVAGVLGIIVIWRLCGIIMDMAEAAGDPALRNKADFRRKLFVAFIIVTLAALGLCLLVPPFICAVAIGGLVMAIVVLCLMMGLMKATQNMCRRYGGGPPALRPDEQAPGPGPGGP